MLEEARKIIGFITTDHRYIIVNDNGIYKIIRPYYCEPESSHYPIDPHIVCIDTKIVYETDNQIELIDKLIEMLNDKVRNLTKAAEELKEEYSEEFVEELGYYDDIREYESVIKMLNDVKRGKIRSGTIKKSYIIELNLNRLFT